MRVNNNNVDFRSYVLRYSLIIWTKVPFMISFAWFRVKKKKNETKNEITSLFMWFLCLLHDQFFRVIIWKRTSLN